MGINLSLKEFEDINLYSNGNMERVIRGIVNQSSNAALVSVFEDQVILLDHTKGKFYTAEYAFDKDKASFVFENFDEVEIQADESNFKNDVYEYFDNEDASALELAKSFKEEVLSQEKFIKEMVNESLAFKDFSNIVDYSELRSLDEDVSIKNEKFFKAYSERLKSHPLNEAKFFDWENPVYVSLMETENKTVLSSTAKAKANDLWKIKSFKEKFAIAAKTFVEDFEEGSELFAELFEDHKNIFLLDRADRKTLFGKTLITINELREDYNDILKGLESLFEDNDVIVSMLNEAQEEYEDDEDDEDMDDEEDEDEDAMELTPEEMKKLVNELKKVSEKIEDEKLKEKLDKIVVKLEGDEEEEVTKPEEVKEAVYILGMLL